ncbi:MAG: hypothetical protein ACYC26_06820 [Phycisphaerales bacterium]
MSIDKPKHTNPPNAHPDPGYPLYKDRLEELRLNVARFQANLPASIRPFDIPSHAKIPFKVLSLRETSFHRIVDLSQFAIEAIDRGHPVPAYILARSVMETTALAYKVAKEVENVLKRKHIGDFDKEIIMPALLGSGERPTPFTGHESLRVKRLIGAIGKTFSGFPKMYGRLCEYAHPNVYGTLWGYSGQKDDYDAPMSELVMKLGSCEHLVPTGECVLALLATTTVFEHYYNRLGEMLPEFTIICENCIKKPDSTNSPDNL